MKRVIIIDVDGVMIPLTYLLVNKRAMMERDIPETTIAVLNEMCRRSDAKVVFNTTHNASKPGVPNLVMAMVSRGLNAKYLHKDPQTDMPRLDRAQAVDQWFARGNHADQYLIFDDSKFTQNDNLIVVDPQAGLHIGHLDILLDRWNLPPCLIMV